MLGVLLKILSIIGIGILVILLLLLLILAIVLFSPITYRLQGAKEVGESFWGKVNATYLFGMIRIKYAYPDPGKLIVKFLCFTLYDTSKPKKEKKSKSKKKNKDNKEKTDSNENIDTKETKIKETKTKEINTKEIETKEIDTAETDTKKVADPANKMDTQSTKADTNSFETIDHNEISKENTEVSKKPGSDMENESSKLDKFCVKADMDEEKDSSVDKDDKVSIKDKIKGFFEKIRAFEYKIRKFIHNTRNKTEKIKQKISKTYHEICFYKDLATGKEGAAFIEHLKKRSIKILKVIRPRKYQVSLVFGADSPDITGYVVAGYGMIFPHIKKPNRFDLETDFTESVFEGTFDIKGHFMLFTIVINGLMLLLDRNFKRIRHKMKRHKKAALKAA